METRNLIRILMFLSAATFQSASSNSTCPPVVEKFLHDLNSQCLLSIPFSSPLVQVDGESVEQAVSSNQKNKYIAVLFYASWCPFSSVFQEKFYTLSFMYPQIKHLAVEQSSAMPSVFSRYGVHSVPSLLIVNQTTRVRYYGRKDLPSLVNFYRRTTGMDPEVDMVEDTSHNSEISPKVYQRWTTTSLKETFSGELYLVLSIAFVLFRFFPQITSCLMALWATFIPHLNLGIFGESRQLIGRVLHLIDVKRIWSKLKLCKTRNFQKGARNARVLASSLASVSLGETSSSRAFS